MEFSEHKLLANYRFKSAQPLLIDVGAHHGGVSRLFAEKGWRVIAFEPEQKNRSAFESNLAGFEQISCIPKAVSDVTAKSVPFYVSDEHYGIHSLKPFHHTHRLKYEVETICLDDILEELHIREVALLKVDTEGADFLALKGLDFEKRRPELAMIEFMDQRSLPHFGYSHHDVSSYMKERGYTTFVSEWAPIKEYAREGIAGEPHVWLQCVEYPQDHEPAWGNLIFVPDGDTDKFRATLESYLRHVPRSERSGWIRNQISKVPRVMGLCGAIKRIGCIINRSCFKTL